MKTKNIIAVAIIIISALVMITDPFGFSTPKQYTANTIGILAIALSIGLMEKEDEE